MHCQYGGVLEFAITDLAFVWQRVIMPLAVHPVGAIGGEVASTQLTCVANFFGVCSFVFFQHNF
jgi:hypothetical protein